MKDVIKLHCFLTHLNGDFLPLERVSGGLESQSLHKIARDATRYRRTLL